MGILQFPVAKDRLSSGAPVHVFNSEK